MLFVISFVVGYTFMMVAHKLIMSYLQGEEYHPTGFEFFLLSIPAAIGGMVFAMMVCG